MIYPLYFIYPLLILNIYINDISQESTIPCGNLTYQWEISRILKWRYVSTICLAIFSGDIPLHRSYIGLIYGRYLQSRILKWPLTITIVYS